MDDMKFIFIQQPGGWPGPKIQTDMPMLVNLRQDPFERTPMVLGETSATGTWGYGNEFFGREAWRFVAAQQEVLKLALTAVEYPPMQDPVLQPRCGQEAGRGDDQGPLGQVTIYMQKDSPGGDNASNWLPAPDGPIYVAMRLYWPKEAALAGRWKPPAVQRTK